MEHHVRVNLLGAALALGLGAGVSLVTSTVVASRAYRARAGDTARQTQEITVKGSARTQVRSDLAVWRVVVSGEARELHEAFLLLEASVARVRAFLGDRGFASGEVALGPIDTGTFYRRDEAGRETREVAGYRLERAFTVTTGDVARVQEAAGEVTQLLRESIQVASERPAYTYSKVAELKVEILGAASRDARARAEEIARNSGARVAGVRGAQMGVIQITAPNSTEVASYGIYDTTTVDKDVSVVVTLTLGLE
ncbi:MAG TPA: SIMPL domain-containing protein [Phycisphaerales bacterium]|nr:SIMPL domain-containing protein [Phycisphaerales bacterium]